MAGNFLEIERKYLLSKLPDKVEDIARRWLKIRQGWLPGQNFRVRIRESVFNDWKPNFFWGFKTGNGLVRTEIEDEISREFFEKLWPLTADKRIYKQRWHVAAEGELFWEVDRFDDRQLAMAEIEIPSAEYQVVIPDWLQPFIIREVTDDPQYVNMNMAK